MMIVQIRRKFRNVRFLRSTYFFFHTLNERARWTRDSVAEDLLDQIGDREDPWNYTTNAEETDRFRSALEMLQMTHNGGFFENAFEVGCSEGVFSSMLATRCQSLLAVDLLQVALDRAMQRCKGQKVKFKQWDLFTSPAPPGFDLTVAMDVVEYFSPSDVRYARDKLVSTLRPGGYLLLGNSRQNPIFETSWWGKWMLRGGKRIAEFFADDPRLELLASETKGIYVNALFRLRANDSGMSAV